MKRRKEAHREGIGRAHNTGTLTHGTPARDKTSATAEPDASRWSTRKGGTDETHQLAADAASRAVGFIVRNGIVRGERVEGRVDIASRHFVSSLVPELPRAFLPISAECP